MKLIKPDDFLNGAQRWNIGKLLSGAVMLEVEGVVRFEMPPDQAMRVAAALFEACGYSLENVPSKLPGLQ